MILAFLVAGCKKDPVVISDSGSFGDPRDNHLYKWVRIGEQVWMAENLAYLPAVSPSPVGSETEPHCYVYGYDNEAGSIIDAKTKENYTTYGVLYNWAAAKTACPAGWHLPDDAEWKVLETFLGMSQSDADNDSWRYSGSVGKAIKSNSGWSNKGNGENSCGFNALPGGYRSYAAKFESIGYGATFWTATEFSSSVAWLRVLDFLHGSIYRGNYSRSDGISVRCVQD